MVSEWNSEPLVQHKHFYLKPVCFELWPSYPLNMPGKYFQLSLLAVFFFWLTRQKAVVRKNLLFKQRKHLRNLVQVP
jgi:hypothetical protein